MTACLRDRIKFITSLFVFSAFLFTGCKQSDPNTIGADFIGARNGFNVHLTDTTSLILFSAKHDSIPTKSLSYYMLGDMNDPVFGRSKANIFCQFSIPISQFSFGGAIIDSVVLRLKPVFTTSYYGNISTPQQISIYELKEHLINSTDSGYFSNREYQISENGSRYKPTPIGYFSGVFNFTDSFYEVINGISYVTQPHIRIKLSNAFTNKLQQAEAAGAFLTNDAFQNYINGLAILAETPDGQMMPGQGAIANFNLRQSTSGIVVYFGGNQEIEFPIQSTDIVANQYKHSTSLPLRPYTSSAHSNECYVQAATGIKTRILMPNILDIAKDHAIAIIGAEMVFTVQDGYENDVIYPVPNNLFLLGSDSLGRNVFLEDQFETNPKNYYGGSYDPSLHQYSFNIIRHIQAILNTYRSTKQNINYGMNLILPANDYYYGIGDGRLVLNTNTSLKKVKLNLSYTVIK